MEILITGATGGIGTAIKERLKDHKVTSLSLLDLYSPFVPKEDFDWLICAHGIIDEDNVIETFYANVITNISLAERIKTKNIIFISSTAGIKGNDMFPVYSASKAALNMYAKLISTKKNCYVICPGATDTPMWQKLGLYGKAQSPVEVARVVTHIMAGRFKSGDVITVRNGEIICE